jgi:hypothetical protein
VITTTNYKKLYQTPVVIGHLFYHRQLQQTSPDAGNSLSHSLANMI